MHSASVNIALWIRHTTARLGPYAVILTYILFAAVSAWQFGMLNDTQNRQAGVAVQAAHLATVLEFNQISARDAIAKNCAENRETQLNLATLNEDKARNDLKIAAIAPPSQKHVWMEREVIERTAGERLRQGVMMQCQFHTVTETKAKAQDD